MLLIHNISQSEFLILTPAESRNSILLNLRGPSEEAHIWKQKFFKKKSFIIVVLVVVIALICFTAYGSMRKKDNRVKASGTVEVTEIPPPSTAPPQAGGRILEFNVRRAGRSSRRETIAALSWRSRLKRRWQRRPWARRISSFLNCKTVFAKRISPKPRRSWLCEVRSITTGFERQQAFWKIGQRGVRLCAWKRNCNAENTDAKYNAIMASDTVNLLENGMRPEQIAAA